MTLPINPATPSEAEVASGGDVPVRPCPQPDPVDYTFDFGAGWVEQAGNWAFVFGIEPGSWEPDALIQGTGALSVPITPEIVGAPTRADVPGAWQSFGPLSEPGDPDLFQNPVPVPVPEQVWPPGWSPGEDLWVRMTIVTAEKSTITVWIYMPDGPPTVGGQEFTLYVGDSETETFQELVVPTFAGPDQGPLETLEIITAGEPASPTYGVAVTNACDDNPLKVEGTVSVTEPVTVDGTVTANPPAPTAAALQIGAIGSADGTPDSIALGAGAHSLHVQAFADAGGTITAISIAGVGYRMAPGDTVDIVAPPNKTLPAIELIAAGSGAAAGVEFVVVT